MAQALAAIGAAAVLGHMLTARFVPRTGARLCAVCAQMRECTVRAAGYTCRTCQSTYTTQGVIR